MKFLNFSPFFWEIVFACMNADQNPQTQLNLDPKQDSDTEILKYIQFRYCVHCIVLLFRYNGRLFISWLQDVDDKWEKIKVRYKEVYDNMSESRLIETDNLPTGTNKVFKTTY